MRLEIRMDRHLYRFQELGKGKRAQKSLSFERESVKRIACCACRLSGAGTLPGQFGAKIVQIFYKLFSTSVFRLF